MGGHEGLHYLKDLNKKVLIINIDLSKSYNHVNQRYIKLLLMHLGFEVPFNNQVITCQTSMSFLVLINGSVSNSFNPQRGMRQVFPLSTIFFLLVAEGLRWLIKEEKKKG